MYLSKFVYVFIFSLCFLFRPQPLLADWSSSRPDGHAPIGVMADHTHHAGEWMFSYRYMRMKMNGNRSGTDSVTTAQVHQNFMVAPTRMDMDMHMAGVMWAPMNRLTFMTMVPYLKKSMDHVNRMGRTFTTDTDGIGDIKVSGLLVVCRFGEQQIHLNVGLSLPTGSIDEKDDTLAGPNQQLPYPMQLGSGTYDFLPGVTYLGQTDRWSWGSQLMSILRIDDNSRDYSLGDVLELTVWGALQVSRYLSGSLRLNGKSWGDIDGFDKDINPRMVPTADPNRRAGDRVDFLVGLNYYQQTGFLKGHRLAFEVGAPVYERLDGPQLETDLLFTLGWQKAFD